VISVTPRPLYPRGKTPVTRKAPKLVWTRNGNEVPAKPELNYLLKLSVSQSVHPYYYGESLRDPWTRYGYDFKLKNPSLSRIEARSSSS